MVSVLNAYNALVDKLVEIYGSVEAALEKAYEIYADIVATVKGTIEDAIEIYNKILEFLVDTYGTIENVVIVASQIFRHVYDFISENFTAEQLAKMYNDIVAIVTEVYGTTKDAYYVATQIYTYIVNALSKTFEGNYVVKDDSMYVSLGNAVYGKELAQMLGLSGKYYNFALNGNYLDKVAQADLITIRFDNGEALAFAMGQLQNLGDLDWSKYLDEEGQEALAEILETIKAELVATGKAQELSDAMTGLLPVSGVAVSDEIIAEVLVYILECTLYSYAEFVDRITVTLENVYTVAPEAIVVLTGIQNPLAGLDLSGFGIDFDLSAYTQSVDTVVAGLNLHLLAAAFANENTIFVNSNNAQDIFDALNVVFEPNVPDVPTCNHVYDNCLDTTCNICGEVRVAPGHSFTNYIFNNDASCESSGTETAKCDFCDAQTTRNVGTPAPGHQYGDWITVKEPTSEETGLKKRICSVCGHEDFEELIKLPDEIKISPWAIAAVIGLFALCILMKKKPAAKKAGDKKSDEKSDKKETSEKVTTKK